MWRNRCHALAPSIAAASCSIHGTACSPARKMIIAVPKLRQDAIMISAGIDQFGSPSQFGPVMPTQPSTVLIRPNSVLEQEPPDDGDRDDRGDDRRVEAEPERRRGTS